MKTKTLSTRRKFFWQAGAVLSAPLAVAAANASQSQDLDNTKAQLAELENINAIREVQQSFVHHLNSQAHDQAQLLFLEPKNSNLDKTISRLSSNTSANQDFIELAEDGQSANSRAHYTVQIEAPLSDCTLVAMARQQGDGVHRYSEDRIVENEYIKQDTKWKIKQSNHHTA